jgi:cell division protein FtsL
MMYLLILVILQIVLQLNLYYRERKKLSELMDKVLQIQQESLKHYHVMTKEYLTLRKRTTRNHTRIDQFRRKAVNLEDVINW